MQRVVARTCTREGCVRITTRPLLGEGLLHASALAAAYNRRVQLPRQRWIFVRVAGLGAAVGLFCTFAHAQQPQTMADDKLRAVEAQVANVYGASATEADFAEMAYNRRGHAIFTKGGFVLDYAIPNGRRVWSDFATTRVLDPTARHTLTTYVATNSPYASLLLLTGAVRPSFRSGYDHGMECMVSDSKFQSYRVDIATSRIVIAHVDGHHAMVFTNIHSMTTTAASAALAAGRIP